MNAGIMRSFIVVGVVALFVAGFAVYRGSTGPASVGGERATVETQSATRASAQPARLPRMVDLGADKCIACKKMAPILVELKKEYAGLATIEFIDVWKAPEAGEPYGVRLIPTQVFFDRAGEEVWRHEGFLPKEEIVAKLKELGAG